MIRATSRISSSPRPRVVTAGVPMRRPEVTVGGRSSNGMPFLLTVIPARARRSSPSAPVSGVAERLTRTRWLSVPPLTRTTPPATSSSASARQLRTVCSWRARNSGVRAWPRATALPAITCMSGPPWSPGKTARSTFVPSSSLDRIIPARGPPRVLWVVVVTRSAIPTGDGCWPAATRPAMCAMLTMKSAPTSSAISRKAGKSMMRG